MTSDKEKNKSKSASWPNLWNRTPTESSSRTERVSLRRTNSQTNKPSDGSRVIGDASNHQNSKTRDDIGLGSRRDSQGRDDTHVQHPVPGAWDSPRPTQPPAAAAGVWEVVRHSRTQQSSHKDKVAPEEARDRQVRQVSRDLEKAKASFEECLKRLKDCQKQRDDVTKNFIAVQHAFAKQDAEVDGLKKTITKQNRHIADLTATDERLRRELATITDTSAKQRLHITELTETILHSAHDATTATRDDDYFEAQFAGLAGAIHQWIFRTFRGLPDITHKDLTPVVLESLEAATLGYNPSPDVKITLKEIEAVVVWRLHRIIFCGNFVFKLYGFHYPEDVRKALGGSDLDRRTWHAKTVGMLIKNSTFDTRFHEGVIAVVKDLGGDFIRFVKEDSQEQCYNALHAIVEQAAKLEVEITQQIADFELHWVNPGTEYKSFYMEDRSGAVDDAEEDGGDTQGFIIRMVLFPPVVRWKFDDSGKFIKAPVIVRKATVVATPVETDVD